MNKIKPSSFFLICFFIIVVSSAIYYIDTGLNDFRILGLLGLLGILVTVIITDKIDYAFSGVPNAKK